MSEKYPHTREQVHAINWAISTYAATTSTIEVLHTIMRSVNLDDPTILTHQMTSDEIFEPNTPRETRVMYASFIIANAIHTGYLAEPSRYSAVPILENGDINILYDASTHLFEETPNSDLFLATKFGHPYIAGAMYEVDRILGEVIETGFSTDTPDDELANLGLCVLNPILSYCYDEKDAMNAAGIIFLDLVNAGVITPLQLPKLTAKFEIKTNMSKPLPLDVEVQEEISHFFPVPGAMHHITSLLSLRYKNAIVDILLDDLSGKELMPIDIVSLVTGLTDDFNIQTELLVIVSGMTNIHFANHMFRHFIENSEVNY